MKREIATVGVAYILAYLEMTPLVVRYDGLTGAAAVLGVQRVPGVEAALEFLHLDVVRATTFSQAASS